MLALVLMDALDLDVEQPVGIELDTGICADVSGEALLVGTLNGAPVAQEGSILDMGFELANSVKSTGHRSPMVRLSSSRSPGLASTRKRRGVTPLVLLLKRSGHISALAPSQIRSGTREGDLYAYSRDKSLQHFKAQIRSRTARKAPVDTATLIAVMDPISPFRSDLLE